MFYQPYQHSTGPHQDPNIKQLLALHSYQGWARVPAPLLLHTLRQRGSQGAGEQLRMSWSAHPMAVALRDALMRRIREFPAIRSVWESQARWVDTGAEHLMLHVAVDEPLPSPTADQMVEVLLAEEVKLGDGNPKVAVLALNTTTHAGSIAELEYLGLDTVRSNDGRVEVTLGE